MEVKAELKLSRGAPGYQEVLDDMATAKNVYILTFNISARNVRLLNHLHGLDGKDIAIVSNIPKRQETYSRPEHRKDGHSMISTYLERLDPRSFNASVRAYFNFHNHAKLVATENIAYVGSANFSDESTGNYEAGFLVRGQAEVASIIKDVFEPVRSAAIEYLPDEEDGVRVRLKYAMSRVQAAISAFEEHTETRLDSHFGSPIEDRVVRFLGASDGSVWLKEAEDVLMALLEPGQFSSGVEKILHQYLHRIVDEIHRAAWVKDAPPGGFDSEDFMSTFIQEHPDAYDQENLSQVQEAAGQAAFEEEELWSDRAASLLEQLKDLSRQIDDAVALLEASQRINNAK
jgi:hypothetical protein